MDNCILLIFVEAVKKRQQNQNGDPIIQFKHMDPRKKIRKWIAECKIILPGFQPQGPVEHILDRQAEQSYQQIVPSLWNRWEYVSIIRNKWWTKKSLNLWRKLTCIWRAFSLLGRWFVLQRRSGLKQFQKISRQPSWMTLTNLHILHTLTTKYTSLQHQQRTKGRIVNTATTL